MGHSNGIAKLDIMANVVVIGAGIIGVTTALSILEKDPTIKITVVADEFSPNTTSDGAAGLIMPNCLEDTPIELLRKWTSKTMKTLKNLSLSEQAPQFGISTVTGFSVWDQVQEEPAWKDWMLFYRRMTEKELADFPTQPARFGFCFTTFVAEGRLVIPYLMTKIKELGGTFVKKHITSLSELSEYHVIVNCTGMGARELVGDTLLKPVKGQVLRIKAPWIKCEYRYTTEQDVEKQVQCSSIIPQIDTVVLGKTEDVDDYNTDITPEDTKRIINGTSRIVPSIKNATVLQNWAGLRPSRYSVRLESETINCKDKQGREQTLNVVHNYGHGGAGIALSFGCADDCSDLVLKELANKKKAKL